MHTLHSCSLVLFTLGTCMRTYMLYCITCVQQVCMPLSINFKVNNTSYRVFQLIHSSIWLSSSLCAHYLSVILCLKKSRINATRLPLSLISNKKECLMHIPRLKPYPKNIIWWLWFKNYRQKTMQSNFTFKGSWYSLGDLKIIYMYTHLYLWLEKS